MKRQAFNPYLPNWEFIPDGEPHVFGDRIYIFGSHDRFDGEMFCMNDYIAYSADLNDLSDWRYEGVIFEKEQDPRNAQKEEPDHIPLIYDTVGRFPGGLNAPGVHSLWAPDVVQGPDGRYYLFYCLDFLPEIAVAVCDQPAGRYTFYGLVKDQNGDILGLRPGDRIQFDPGVFIDDDGTIYLYSGNAPKNQSEVGTRHQGSQVMTLQADMLTLASEPRLLLPSLNEPDAGEYTGHEFFEASSIRKINGRYYFVYSSVLSHELCYAVSDRPDEGYHFGGTLVSIGDIGLNGRTEEDSLNCLGNTHGGLECVNGQWYIFYHRQTNRTQYSRQGCAEKVFFDEEGHIAQAEVTSCGLNNGPLHGIGTYPASICCQLTGRNGIVFSDQPIMRFDYPYLTQDEPDVVYPDEKHPGTMRDRHIVGQYIANLTDGCTAGYKYFAFDAGQSPETICFTLRGRSVGTIKVFLDDPKDNCNLIGAADVRIYSDREWVRISGNVRMHAGVHALYLVYEGSGWLDLLQIGLSRIE